MEKRLWPFAGVRNRSRVLDGLENRSCLNFIHLVTFAPTQLLVIDGGKISSSLHSGGSARVPAMLRARLLEKRDLRSAFVSLCESQLADQCQLPQNIVINTHMLLRDQLLIIISDFLKVLHARYTSARTAEWERNLSFTLSTSEPTEREGNCFSNFEATFEPLTEGCNFR